MFPAQIMVLFLVIAAIGLECALSWRSLKTIQSDAADDECPCLSGGSATLPAADAGRVRPAGTGEAMKLRLLEESISHLRRASGAL